MGIARTLIKWTTSRAAQRFERHTLDPRSSQEALLMSILTHNADTEYGRRHGFGTIRSIPEFQERVPIVNYQDIREEVERITRGERNVLVREDPVMFAQTSGTTGKPKFVPVTPSCRGTAQKDLMRTWLHHARMAHPDIFDGKIVTLVSPAVEGYTESGVPFGSASGHIYKSMPGIIRRIYAIPYEVFDIEDYESKYYAIMRIGIPQDVRFLATANPSSILKMCEKADAYADELILDIRRGTLKTDLALDAPIRDIIERRLTSDAALADRLENARRKRDGRLLPGDYWPGLSLIGCWKGGTVGHYLAKFQEWFDPDDRRSVAVRDWGFLSSEARCSVPVSDQGSSGVLSVGANFYEFVETDDLMRRPESPESWRFLTVDQLNVDREYYIFITTTGGLYRYDINDVIRVTGYYNAAPEIHFLRKGRGMTNITGEKLSVNQVIEAVQSAGLSTDALAAHFKAEADPAGSRYLFRVEFIGDPEEERLRSFLHAVDRHLKTLNIEYKGKRESQRLNPPVLHVMREGWYERRRKKQAAEGKRMFQAKTELLSPVKSATHAIRPELRAVIEMDGQDPSGLDNPTPSA